MVPKIKSLNKNPGFWRVVFGGPFTDFLRSFHKAVSNGGKCQTLAAVD